MGKKAAKSLLYVVCIIGTVALCSISIIAAFTRYVSPVDSSAMTILGLLTPLWLILNFIVAIIWFAKLRIWGIIPLIAIACNWNYLSSMYRFGSDGSVKSNATQLNVCTYNAHTFNDDYTGYSAKEVANFIRESKIDVFCVQEYGSSGNFTTDSVTALFSDILEYSYIPAVATETDAAIFSSYPIIRHGFASRNGNASNRTIWCDIVKSNDTIRIYNIHLQSTEVNQVMHRAKRIEAAGGNVSEHIGNSVADNAKKRAFQALAVRDSIKQVSLPVILCGDFNDTPSSYTYQLFNEILTDGFKESGSGLGTTFRYFGDILRIDYIFYSKDFSSIHYAVADKDWSDHKPVVTTLIIKDSSSFE